MSSYHSIAVVGGGISGLTTAWLLHKAGKDVVVLEHDSEVGGTMKTINDNGWLIETGPNSALETTPLFDEVFRSLGISEEKIYASPEADKRYILRNGVLHPLPMKPIPFLRSELWSLKGKFRLLKEPFVGRAMKEESIAEFVERRLGREFLDYAINPFVAGVYAGNPEQLSVRASFPKLYALEEKYGGLIKGQIRGARKRKKRAEKSKDRARLFSFKNGMQSFPSAIAQSLGTKVLCNTTVQKIVEITDDGNQGKFTILGKQGDAPITVTSDVVILAIPSFFAAELVNLFDSLLATSLKKIYYPPVTEVFLGFKTADIHRKLDGFGFLIPEKEKRKILGTIWSSVLFPQRSPVGCSGLTSFVGGSRRPDLAEKDDDEVVRIVSGELKDLMKISGEPMYSRISRWKRAIPQYYIGHLDIMRQIDQFERNHPGFFLTGNYRGGIAVGDCVMNSEKVAKHVDEFLKIPHHAEVV
jgi:protoporphyrinogen/coproporphyrinogen III oxidase